MNNTAIIGGIALAQRVNAMKIVGLYSEKSALTVMTVIISKSQSGIFIPSGANLFVQAIEATNSQIIAPIHIAR